MYIYKCACRVYIYIYTEYEYMHTCSTCMSVMLALPSVTIMLFIVFIRNTWPDYSATCVEGLWNFKGYLNCKQQCECFT